MVTGQPLNFQEPEELRIGGKWYIEPGTYRYDFREWVQNSGSVEADVTEDQIVIKRFTPNTWLLHGPAVTGTAETAICAYCSGFTLKISGLEANRSLFGARVKMINTCGAGSDVPYFRGLEVFPGRFDGNGWYWIQENSYTWEAMWDSPTTRNLPCEADNPNFRGNVGAHGDYGWLGDFDSKVVFPSNIYDIATWERGFGSTPTGNSNTWYYGIGLYGGGIETEADGMVTLNTPITLSQVAAKGIYPDNSCCFDAYYQGDSVYHTARTLGRTWENWGMLSSSYDKLVGSDKTTYVTGISEIGNLLNLKAPVDLIDRIYETGSDGETTSMLKWRVKVNNPSEFWPQVAACYSARTIPCSAVAGLFEDSNCSGEITLNVTQPDNSVAFCMFDEMLWHSDVESIIIKAAKPNMTASTGHRAFGCAAKLTSIQSEIPFVPKDVSGMFEQCGALSEYPSNLINWRAWTDYCNFGWFADLSGLTKIPSFSPDRMSDVIKPSTMQQSFRCCTKLTSVGPVIDMISIEPDTALAYYTFYECTALSDIRIKNLNHGDWHFDGSSTGNASNVHGTLKSLDQDSINYLIDNLADLTKHVDGDTSTGKKIIPKVSSATIYCPAEWKGKISATRISAAKAKGWTLSGV